MEYILETIELFSDKHPVWFWLLVRLAICFCWTFAVITGLLVLIVAIAPLMGAIIGVWLLIPILIVACWGCVSLAIRLFDEFCESW